jgi:tRNA(Ile)-lysidine synthase TilS/MesJ
MIPYLKNINVPYFIEKTGPTGKFKSLRRASIYQCARRENYNVVAFGQNLDDLAVSFVKSSFHYG